MTLHEITYIMHACIQHMPLGTEDNTSKKKLSCINFCIDWSSLLGRKEGERIKASDNRQWLPCDLDCPIGWQNSMGSLEWYYGSPCSQIDIAVQKFEMDRPYNSGLQLVLCCVLFNPHILYICAHYRLKQNCYSTSLHQSSLVTWAQSQLTMCKTHHTGNL